jgi:adenylate cyclase
MLAVLPFKTVGHPEDGYFADGVTEEITSRLASLRGLGVISRTSTDQYRTSNKPLREIARELGVQYVLEGSVRWERPGGGARHVRVTPQLIRVSDDSHLWAQRYDADADSVLAAQGDIAEQVTAAVAVTMRAPNASPGRPRSR